MPVIAASIAPGMASTASAALSISSSRTMRPRLAPRAMRMATSRWRSAPCATSRLTTLAQAISSTKMAEACHSPSTGPSPSSSIPRDNVITRTARSLLASGYCCRRRSPTMAISVRASGSDRPSRRRPMTVSERRSRTVACSGLNASGTHTSVPLGNSNPIGATPTTSYDSPSSTIVRPTIAGSPPNRRCQRLCPTMARRAWPDSSSSGRKLRPMTGCTPSVRKKSAETRKPCTPSGSSVPMTLTFHHCIATRLSNAVVCWRQSRKFAGDTVSWLNAPVGEVSRTNPTRSTCGNGNGWMTRASIIAKIVALAPRPRDRVSAINAVCPGRLTSVRQACRASMIRVCTAESPGTGAMVGGRSDRRTRAAARRAAHRADRRSA